MHSQKEKSDTIEINVEKIGQKLNKKIINFRK